MVDLLRLALAAYRLARLLVVDEGPGDVFQRIRMAAGAYSYGPDGLPETALGRVLNCQHCTGVWAALLLVVLHRLGATIVIDVLAVAGLQSVIFGGFDED